MDRRERDLRCLAKENGCTIERSGGGHWLITTPAGGRIVAPGTSSDFRSIRNVIATLRRTLRAEEVADA